MIGLSVKKGLSNATELNPKKHFDNSVSIIKRDITHKPPAVDTSAQDAMLEQQRLAQASLDEEENRRRKRLFAAAQGARAYRGSPLFRRPGSDTAGAAAPAAGTARAVSGSRGGAGPRGGNGRTFIP